MYHSCELRAALNNWGCPRTLKYSLDQPGKVLRFVSAIKKGAI